MTSEGSVRAPRRDGQQSCQQGEQADQYQGHDGMFRQQAADMLHIVETGPQRCG